MKKTGISRLLRYAALMLAVVLMFNATGIVSLAAVEEYALGDVSLDDQINAVDATRILLHTVDKITLADASLLCADVNEDAEINTVDAARILLHVVGKITITGTISFGEPDNEVSIGHYTGDAAKVEYDRTQDALTEDDFLKTDGTVLRNESGEGAVINLNGTNLGGWLHLEGWMDGGGGDNNDYAVRSALLKRFTEAEVDALLDIYQSVYITEDDLDYISSVGANCVRIPIFWMELMDNQGNMKAGAFNELDWAIEECSERGMYVIIDLHGGPGGHSAGWLTGGHSGSNELWTNETYQAWAVTIWETIAARYEGNPAVAGYGLLNEPVAPNNAIAPVQAMYDKLYKAVRAIDEDHVIILGAFYNMDYLGDPKAHNWTNVVYETHHYNDGDRSDGAQQSFVAGQADYIKQYMNKWGMPVLAGEFNFWSSGTAWENWFQSLNEMNVSWCNWNYKNTDPDASKNWGWYYIPTVPTVDYVNDSYEEIAEKWSQYGSENYVQNTFLQEIFTKYTYYHYEDVMASYEEDLLPRDGWVVRAYRANGGDPAGNMLDGRLSTRWANGEEQKPDTDLQWVELDLGKEQTFSQVLMYTPNSDCAKGYVVSVSTDGETWTEVTDGVAVAGVTEATFDEVTARYVKINQVGNGPTNFWSIHELYVSK